MPDLIVRHWQQGPGRSVSWDMRLPFPSHRTMAGVLAEERETALAKGAVAFARARKQEEQNNGPA